MRASLRTSNDFEEKYLRQPNVFISNGNLWLVCFAIWLQLRICDILELADEFVACSTVKRWLWTKQWKTNHQTHHFIRSILLKPNKWLQHCFDIFNLCSYACCINAWAFYVHIRVHCAWELVSGLGLGLVCLVVGCALLCVYADFSIINEHWCRLFTLFGHICFGWHMKTNWKWTVRSLLTSDTQCTMHYCLFLLFLLLSLSLALSLPRHSVKQNQKCAIQHTINGRPNNNINAHRALSCPSSCALISKYDRHLAVQNVHATIQLINITIISGSHSSIINNISLYS